MTGLPEGDGAVPGRRRRRWQDLTGRQRAVLLGLGIVQWVLAATAWRDLARRRPAEVAGRKGVWAVVIGINWVGPIAYFGWGRRSGTGS
ncbi:PLDc N-terminal domain-containing protein [Geodermatophilus sp. CPCC 206100]|uniref:PLDc N-terminal domain-containing protein n=1 Tax=Geodermatophilus sp. CPCC 206100 TaxID=3020054 RepID=UPI003B002A33